MTRFTTAIWQVIFLPAGQPWMKSDRPILQGRHRIAMTRRAIEDRPYFKLSTIEVEHKGPSYSVDTITKLKAQSAGASDLYFIIGWDNLNRIMLWKDPLKLIKLRKVYPSAVWCRKKWRDISKRTDYIKVLDAAN